MYTYTCMYVYELWVQGGNHYKSSQPRNWINQLRGQSLLLVRNRFAPLSAGARGHCLTRHNVMKQGSGEYIYIYIHIHIHMHVHIHIHIHIYICICTLTCTYIYIYVHVHMHIPIRTYIYTYVCMSVYELWVEGGNHHRSSQPRNWFNQLRGQSLLLVRTEGDGHRAPCGVIA